jgi:hypothetical protein
VAEKSHPLSTDVLDVPIVGGDVGDAGRGEGDLFVGKTDEPEALQRHVGALAAIGAAMAARIAIATDGLGFPLSRCLFKSPEAPGRDGPLSPAGWTAEQDGRPSLRLDDGHRLVECDAVALDDRLRQRVVSDVSAHRNGRVRIEVEPHEPEPSQALQATSECVHVICEMRDPRPVVAEASRVERRGRKFYPPERT